MKTRKIFILTFLLLIFAAGSVYAATVQNATVTVKVNPIFSISIDRDDIDFGVMKPGQNKYDIPATGIKVNVQSNSGNPWFLRINDTDDLSSGSAFISNYNFFWYGWAEGSGSWYGTGKDRMTTTPVVAYASTNAEGLNMPNGTNCYFKFKLKVPHKQVGGRYETTVQFTITE